MLLEGSEVTMAVDRNGRITDTSEELVCEAFQSFLTGDNTAFSVVYRELNPRFSAYCYKVSTANADDLMQELWERVIALRSTNMQHVVSPVAFLFRMLRNLVIDQHRRSKDEISLEEGAISMETPTGRETTDLETIILEALEKLPEADKEILVLNIYSGYKFGEIAEMLGKSSDAVWQQASRARTKLRTIVLEDAKRLHIALPPMKETKKDGAIA